MFDDTDLNVFQKEALKERKKEEPYFEDTHVRATFLIRRDLAAKLEKEVDYISKLVHRKKGIKTEIIIHILEEYLNKSLAEREKG